MWTETPCRQSCVASDCYVERRTREDLVKRPGSSYSQHMLLKQWYFSWLLNHVQVQVFYSSFRPGVQRRNVKAAKRKTWTAVVLNVLLSIFMILLQWNYCLLFLSAPQWLNLTFTFTSANQERFLVVLVFCQHLPPVKLSTVDLVLFCARWVSLHSSSPPSLVVQHLPHWHHTGTNVFALSLSSVRLLYMNPSLLLSLWYIASYFAVHRISDKGSRLHYIEHRANLIQTFLHSAYLDKEAC